MLLLIEPDGQHTHTCTHAHLCASGPAVLCVTRHAGLWMSATSRSSDAGKLGQTRGHSSAAERKTDGATSARYKSLCGLTSVLKTHQSSALPVKTLTPCKTVGMVLNVCKKGSLVSSMLLFWGLRRTMRREASLQ